ncbi:titin-like isoform X2 [Trematomus bernacchii]|uniref:titin-like isoform X2 n=1 Tax=Trematomus bernacchii TaxID=40690 RepID=UPI00146EEECD|nr:titin-like isoform X2 [Trematomus bernacchii]
MTQPSSTASTCATRWKMWLFKILSVICFTAVCAAQDPEDVTSSFVDTTIPIETTIPYEPPVPTVQRLSSWLDVFPSEKVEFGCNVNGSSDWTITWYRDAEQLQDTDPNVSASGSKLTITATTTTTGRYSCKGHHKTKLDVTTENSAPVQLTVYANPPKPTLTRSSKFNTMFPGESVTFTCKVNVSSGWSYLWYHNNTEIQTSDAFRVDINHSKSGQYHCKAKRGKSPFFTEVSEATTLQVSDTPKPFLKLLSPWMEVFENETVEFSCEAESDDWTITWYRNEKEVQDDLHVETMDSSLNITSVTQAYQGRYSCKAELESRKVRSEFSNTADLRVYGNTPKPTASKGPTLNPMYVGETVNFTCKVTVSSGWEYQWYRNGVQTTTGETISIPLSLSNQGKYWCMAYRGDTTQTEFSDEIQQDVLDPPKPSLKLLSPWMEVFENETVEFSCEAESDDWTITWYRNEKEVQFEVDLIEEPMDSYLNITSVTQAYQGRYSCKAELESRKVRSEFSNTTDLRVYGNTPKPTASKGPTLNPMYVGETVNFTCKVTVSSGWEYQWYRNGVQTTTGETISIPLSLSNQGKYWCMAYRGDTTQTEFSDEIQQDVLEIPVPTLKRITPWLDVFPTEGVKLSCGMNDSSDWIYKWSKDGNEVQADKSPSFDLKGATLSISSASAAHTGHYTCKGQLGQRSVSSRFSSTLNLTVYDKKPTVLLQQDPEYNVMFPGESVSFSCHIDVSTGWEYLFYQNRKPLNASGNKYPISSVDITHLGSYTCEAKRGSGQNYFTIISQAIGLKVEGNKPKPSMTQQPDVDKVYTGESVSFECTVEASTGWVYHWFKDGTPLPIKNRTFSINDANLSNSGSYSCMATRDKTKYNTQHSERRSLRVSEIPVPSLKPITQWQDVFPTEGVKLSCGMDGSSDWKYTWFRNGQLVRKEDEVLYFGSDAATLSISSASASQRGQYSCSAQLKSRSVSSNSSSETTLEVYDTKPRVTLMQNPKHNVMHTGDAVTFSCHVNVSSGWEYWWLKDGRSFTSKYNHTISSVVTTNTSYQCQVRRGTNTAFRSDLSQAVGLEVKERPTANIILLTGWSEVFSTDSLVLQCEMPKSQDIWNYTWFKERRPINLISEKHTVTPQNNPEQSLYTCQGTRSGRPTYSKFSESFTTKNLLLKRRVLLSISGLIFFGIIAVLLGCIVLRVFRKPDDGDEKLEETELFLTMAQLKERDDAPCPMVQYITDAELNSSPKEGEENGTACSETPLPITSHEDQAVTIESSGTTESNGGLVSFKQ